MVFWGVPGASLDSAPPRLIARCALRVYRLHFFGAWSVATGGGLVPQAHGVHRSKLTAAAGCKELLKKYQIRNADGLVQRWMQSPKSYETEDLGSSLQRYWLKDFCLNRALFNEVQHEATQLTGNDAPVWRTNILLPAAAAAAATATAESASVSSTDAPVYEYDPAKMDDEQLAELFEEFLAPFAAVPADGLDDFT